MEALTGRHAARLGALMAALTALVLAYAAWGPLPMRLDDWRWFRVASPAWESALAPLAVYALIGLAAFAAWQQGEQLGRRWQALFVAALVALAFVGQVLAARQLPGDYNESIIALGKPGANRYHAAARGVKALGPVLADYAGWMRDPSHKLVVTHPAGPLTLYWALNHVFAGREAAAHRFVSRCEDLLASGTHIRDPQGPPAIAGLFREMSEAELAGVWLASFLLRLAAALAIWPVFAMARAVYGLRAAIAAAALTGVVPSFLLFSPGLDQALPALAVTACWLGWTAGARGSPWRAAAAGAVVSAGLFFSLAFAIVAALAGLLCLAGRLRSEMPEGHRDLGVLAGAAAAGLAAPAIMLYLATGYNSLAVWAACLEANAKFNAQVGRAYWKWLLANPVEFLVFLGVPVACLFIGSAVSAARDAWRTREWGKADWPTLILAGMLLALNLSGANRGEVARLWMFLMPGCVIAAAAHAGSFSPYRRAVLVAAFALQVVQATILKSLLDVLLGMYRELA